MCTYIYAGRSGNEKNIRRGKTPNFLALDVEEDGGRILWSPPCSVVDDVFLSRKKEKKKGSIRRVRERDGSI
jgi:hypothetical protein